MFPDRREVTTQSHIDELKCLYVPMKVLTEFAFNKYSQFGEDGIIEKIFQIIGPTSKLCVEFGAWDGFHLSNTANLWRQGWRAVLIEGNKRRFKQLQKNVKDFDCICIHAFVERDGRNSLESILSNHNVSEQIDLLSIDVDGNDYYIYESLKEIRPRVLICEYNPTIPAEMDLAAEYQNYFGCSVSALNKLAEQKGYVLIAITQTNCIFVLKEYESLFSGFETRLKFIKNDNYVRYLITSYSGDYVLSKGELAYGVSFPYGGNLIGEYSRVKFYCRVLRPLFAIMNSLKHFVGARLR